MTAGLDMCRGQSLESEITENSTHDLDCYLRMIELKTSALIRGACQSGAVLGGGSDESVEAMGDYGKHLGIAFQIVDDLFTFTGDSETIGKHPVSDICNRRLTLPLLLAYREADAEDVRLLDQAFAGALDPDEVLAVVTGVVRRSNALDASREIARQHVASAVDALAPLPATASRERLSLYAEYAVERVR